MSGSVGCDQHRSFWHQDFQSCSCMLPIIGQQTMLLFFLLTVCTAVEICAKLGRLLWLYTWNSRSQQWWGKGGKLVVVFMKSRKTWERQWLALVVGIDTRYNTVKFLRKQFLPYWHIWSICFICICWKGAHQCPLGFITCGGVTRQPTSMRRGYRQKTLTVVWMAASPCPKPKALSTIRYDICGTHCKMEIQDPLLKFLLTISRQWQQSSKSSMGPFWARGAVWLTGHRPSKPHLALNFLNKKMR